MANPPITCNRCDHSWTGLSVAHCAGCCARVGGPAATFSTARYFDLHRDQRGERGACLDPAGIRGRDGAPLLDFRDGMWRGPEMSEEAKAKAFGKAS